MRALPSEGQPVMIRTIFSVFSFVLAFSVSAQDLSDKQRAEIEERIKPVG